MYTRRRFLMATAAAAGSAVALASGCAPVAPAPVATAVPTVSQITALKIGVLLPYTESSIGVDVGLNQKRTADLYLKQHGGMLGGRPVNLVYSAESIESAINKVKVQTLTDKEKVDLLLGGASSDAATVLRQAAESAKLVYLATNASDAALTRDSKYVFRTSATASQLGTPFGEWAATNAHPEFYVCAVDTPATAEIVDAFVGGLARHGGTGAARVAVQSGANWGNVVAAIRTQPIKNVFAAFDTDDAEGFLDAWQKQGASAAGYQLFGPGALADEEVLAHARDAAVGVTSALFWSPDLDNAENKALVEVFPREYVDDDTGQPVSLNGYAVEMWDAMTALDLALKQTGGNAANADTLVAALEAVTFSSPRGAFAFDRATHSPVQDVYVRKVVTSPTGNAVNAVQAKISVSAVPGQE